MLAFAADEVRDEVLEGGPLAVETEHTITNAAALREQLTIAHEQGYATDKDETALESVA